MTEPRNAETAADDPRMKAVIDAGRELVEIIERYRPLDGPWPSEAYNRIHDAQDKLIAALKALDGS